MTLVPIRYSRVLDHPLGVAYEWLTDYQDDDPARTTAVVKRRPVIERHADRIVMDGTLEIMGNKGSGKVEVRLFPPDRWVATIIEGAGRGSVYEYQLTAIDANRSRLDINYGVRAKRWRKRMMVRLARPFIRRELNTMWDGFAAAMARELPK